MPKENQFKPDPPHSSSMSPFQEVTRQRLLGILDKTIHMPLIVVEGPAGSGKSTLLSHWRSQSTIPSCEVHLEKRDHDPRLFWAKVIQAIGSIDPSLSGLLLHHLEGPQPLPLPNFLRQLHDTLSRYQTNFVLLLDDFHFIENCEIMNDLKMLIIDCPSCLSLIISTRSKPNFPLAKWEIAGRALSLKWASLRFSLEETRSFFDHSWNDELVQAAWKLTEGWVSGLRLLAISGNDFSGPTLLNWNREQLSSYLYQEVFTQLSLEMQDFLLITCLLNSFDLSLSQYLTRLPNSNHILEELSNRQLFLILVDERQKRFRYHHLFEDFLRNKVEHDQPEKVRQTHQRTAFWYFEKGNFEESFNHAIAAKSFPLALQALELLAERLLEKSAFPLFLKHAQSLPEKLIRESPKLCLDLATAHIMTYQWHPYQKRMTQLEALLKNRAVAEPVIAGAHILKANIARQTGKLSEASDHCKKALTLLEKERPRRKAEALIIAGASSFFKAKYSQARDYLESCINYCQQDDGAEIVYLGARALLGDLDLLEGYTFEAAQNLKATVHEIEDEPKELAIPMAAMVYVCYSDLLYLRNQLQTARAYLEKAQTLAVMGNLSGPLLRILLAQCRLYRALGDSNTAEDFLSKSAKLMAEANIQKWQQNNYHLEAARLALDLKDLERAEAHFAMTSNPGNDEVCFNRHQDTLVRLQIDLIKKSKAFSSIELDDTIAYLKKHGQVWDWFRFKILQVRVHSSHGNLSEAFAELAVVLGEAESRDISQPFLNGGKDIGQLIRQLFEFNARRTQSKSRPYSKKFLAKINSLFLESRLESGVTKISSKNESSTLTRRETEVLAIIARGKSNAYIAEKLHVSMATLKTHINRIYAKLEIKSRAQAILTAQEMGLG